MNRLARHVRLALPVTCLLAAAGALPAETADSADLPHAFDAGWHGVKTCEVLFANTAVRVARCAFPPGVGHERHFHRPHFGYVLSGGTQRIEQAGGTREVTLEAGSHWSSGAVTVHEVMNIGSSTTAYLIVEPLGADPAQD